MRESRSKVLEEINAQQQQEQDKLNDTWLMEDILNQTLDLDDTTSQEDRRIADKKEKLSAKRQDIEKNMPPRYATKDLWKLLNKSDRTVTDLKTEENHQILSKNNLGTTEAELKEIDKVLYMIANGEEFEETEGLKYNATEMQEAFRGLMFKKSRDLSQILINDHSKSDSPEMKALKAEVLRLSYHLEMVKDDIVTTEGINDIVASYTAAIKFCDDYLSTKKHNARYEKVLKVWEGLSYERDCLVFISTEDYSERSDFTMGELLGMSRSETHVARRRNPVKAEKNAALEDLTLTQTTSDLLTIFDKNHNFRDDYAAARNVKSKKKLALQNYALLGELKKFVPGKTQILDITYKGKKVRMLQKADNKLVILDNHQRVPLDITTQAMKTRLFNDILITSEYYDDAKILGLMTEYEDKSSLNLGSYTNSRDNLSEYLSKKLNLKKDVFNNAGRDDMISYVKGLINKTMTVEQIKNLVENAKKSEELINGIELTEMMEINALRGEQLDKQVSMYKVQADGDNTDWTEEEKAVKNLMSELVYTSDTQIMDQNAKEPKEFVRTVLLDNVKALEILRDSKDTDLIDSIMKKMSLDKVSDDKNDNFAQTIAESVKEFALFLRSKNIQDIKAAIENKQDEEMNEKLSATHSKMDESIKKSANIMQKNVNKLVDAMFDETEANEEKDPLLAIMKNATRSDSGQGLFIKTVLKNYFAKMNTLDQRAMLSSALRSCRKVNLQISDDQLLRDLEKRKLKRYKKLIDMNKDFLKKGEKRLNEEEKKLLKEYKEEIAKYRKEKEELMINSNYFAGLIRGAGPLLHKMLQGIPEDTLPDEIRLAIRDVKSKLAPIPERVVKTQMNAMIESSNGAITKIEVLSNLGAASVGQTFRCKVYGPNLAKEGQKVVIKLLRPDCQNRMKREEKVMLDCAKEVNQGMHDTYKGQLSNYYMELDLSQEEKNIADGQIYNGRSGDVFAEKSSNIIKPTANYLMIEEAPGKTLDDILLDSVKTRQRLMEETHDTKVDEEGNVEVLATIPYSRENIIKTRNARNELINLANDLIKKRDILAHITKIWIEEALFKSGYYHADLHAGNILISEDRGTLIDFGNAVKFSEDQQSSITKMMTAAAASNVDMFFEEFNKLLDMNDPEFQKFYDEDKRAEVKEAFEEILDMGDDEQAGERISAALIKASELGVKLPSSIFNFSQGQLRLQKSIDDINRQIQGIEDDINRLDRDFRRYDNFAFGLNMVIDGAYKSNVKGGFGSEFKRQLDALGDLPDEELFIKEVLDKTYKKGDKAKGKAEVNKRYDFDNKYLGSIADFKANLMGRNPLFDFVGAKNRYYAYRDKWQDEFKRIENDETMTQEEKEKALKAAKKEQEEEGLTLFSTLFPSNLTDSIYKTIGVQALATQAFVAITALDDSVMDQLMNIYGDIIPAGLELEEKLDKLRELQDKGKLSKEQEKDKAKEVYAVYCRYVTAKSKSNPVTTQFLGQLRKLNSADITKKHLQFMFEEQTKTTVEKDGKDIEVTLGEHFKNKVDEYFNLTKKYARKGELYWNRDNVTAEDKPKIKKLEKELEELHLEITKIQAKFFYKDRYTNEISVKSYGFGQVMKDVIGSNFISYTGKVGIFNLFSMAGTEIVNALKSYK